MYKQLYRLSLTQRGGPETPSNPQPAIFTPDCPPLRPICCRKVRGRLPAAAALLGSGMLLEVSDEWGRVEQAALATARNSDSNPTFTRSQPSLEASLH